MIIVTSKAFPFPIGQKEEYQNRNNSNDIKANKKSFKYWLRPK